VITWAERGPESIRTKINLDENNCLILLAWATAMGLTIPLIFVAAGKNGMRRAIPDRTPRKSLANPLNKWSGNIRHISRSSHETSEEWKDIVGVRRDFTCECGVVQNRAGDQVSSVGGNRGDEGGRDADHLIGQFLIII
jgi:hypothetical protein